MCFSVRNRIVHTTPTQMHRVCVFVDVKWTYELNEDPNRRKLRWVNVKVGVFFFVFFSLSASAWYRYMCRVFLWNTNEWNEQFWPTSKRPFCLLRATRCIWVQANALCQRSLELKRVVHMVIYEHMLEWSSASVVVCRHPCLDTPINDYLFIHLYLYAASADAICDLWPQSYSTAHRLRCK